MYYEYVQCRIQELKYKTSKNSPKKEEILIRHLNGCLFLYKKKNTLIIFNRKERELWMI